MHQFECNSSYECTNLSAMWFEFECKFWCHAKFNHNFEKIWVQLSRLRKFVQNISDLRAIVCVFLVQIFRVMQNVSTILILFECNYHNFVSSVWNVSNLCAIVFYFECKCFALWKVQARYWLHLRAIIPISVLYV